MQPKILRLMYTCKAIHTLLVVSVDVSASGQCANVKLVIAKGVGLSLLGHDWLRGIQLNWNWKKIKNSAISKDTVKFLRRSWAPSRVLK